MLCIISFMGADTGRTVPRKFEVGDGPCIRPPNILRSTVIGCDAKYELTKKVSRRNFVFWNRSRKGSYMLYIRFQTVETEKVRKVSILRPKMSDDLIFLVIDSSLSVFSLSLLSENLIYNIIFIWPFSWPISEHKIPPWHVFCKFVLCLTYDNSTSQNIGETDAWAVPHLISLRPWVERNPWTVNNRRW